MGVLSLSISSVFFSWRSYFRESLGISSTTARSSNSSTRSLTSSPDLIQSLMEEGTSSPSSSKTTHLTIRWASSSDIKDLVKVEAHADTSDVTWGARDFYMKLDEESPCKVLVAAIGEEVVGYVAFSPHPKSHVILSLIVHPNHRKRGIGGCLVHSLCHVGEQTNLVAYAREENLPYHLFLQSLGFICTRVENKYFESPDGNAYKFVYAYTHEDGES